MDDPFAGWKDGPANPELTGNEVHVWGWTLAGGVADLARVQALLSDDEIARMRAFRFAPDAERYARGRAGLRRILGQYLEIDPGAVRFVYGDYGKPGLRDEQVAVEFNLSHTQAIAVAAFCVGSPVGIDVEERYPVSRTLGQEVFSERELSELEAYTNEWYIDGFFNGWTRKEAVCKAEGLGFHLTPKTFSVSMLRGEPARVVDGGGVLSRPWRLVELPLQEGIAGCVAVDGSYGCVEFYQMN